MRWWLAACFAEVILFRFYHAVTHRERLFYICRAVLALWLIGLSSSVLAPFGPRIKPCLKHGLVTSDGRVLLHMSVHLGVNVQCEEALQ